MMKEIYNSRWVEGSSFSFNPVEQIGLEGYRQAVQKSDRNKLQMLRKELDEMRKNR